MKFDLQLRDLKSGERSIKTFDDAEEAKSWLRERPKFTEVLGMASHHVSREVSDELKATMRPLDAEEQLLERQLEQAADDRMREAAEKRRAKEVAEAERMVAEMADADPNRPMEVRYRFDADLSSAVAGDERPITAEARAAVEAWVAERNEWVEARGQIIGEAKVQVWPGPIPEGEGDKRVISGSFVPVTGSKDD
jgi:hypothetical protein